MTPRIAVVGGNGRVGAEVCLRLLGSKAGVDVIPIARNRSGSAFLRLSGLECRHGRMERLEEARGLLAGCDVVLHLAYAFPRSRAQHQANVRLTRNVVEAARKDASVILASTIMVYAPNLPFRIPSAYGIEKLLLERTFMRAAKARGRIPLVWRIGHVLGDLQPLSIDISSELAMQSVLLPAGGDRASNTVFAATLAEATHLTSEFRVASGTYDLVTHPQWTWRQVYEYHAAQKGISLNIVQSPNGHQIKQMIWRVASASAERLSRTQIREHLLTAVQLAPTAVADRAYGAYLRAGARRAGRLNEAATRSSNPALRWRPLPFSATVPGLHDPITASELYPLPL